VDGILQIVRIYFYFFQDQHEYQKRNQNFVFTSCIVYGVFLIIFIIWTLLNLWAKWEEIIEPVPGSGFEMKKFQQLIYPAITLCNVTPNVTLTHLACMNYEKNDIRCEYKEHKQNIKKTRKFKKDDKHSEENHCLIYNNNLEGVFVANKLGIEDMIILTLSINIYQYPKNYFLSGVYVYLTEQEKINLNNFGLVASPGEIYLIRLKKSVKEFINSTNNEENFDMKISTLTTNNFEGQWGHKNNTIVLAFLYQDLNVLYVKELPPYDIYSFLSETGGLIGLLVGASLVNLLIFLLQWAWGLRSNELKWADIKNKDEDNLDTENKNSKNFLDSICLL